ncbi:MAG: auxin-responsive protein [Candidatus Heteroscillospira sp.]
MNLDDKLSNRMYKSIWQQYCGFLDLSLSEYMEIQKRLMLEQLSLYAPCPLGKRIMGGVRPETIDEFRRTVPLTTYADYADILLEKRAEALPAPPVIWIETTWEGGSHPIKTAPYTQSMIDHHRGSILSAMILSTSDRRGSFALRRNPNFLFGMAPLPFFTGIIPYALEGEFNVNFMPKVNDAGRMSFGDRNKLGFKLGLAHDIDLFFGMSSVMARMSELLPGFLSGGGGMNMRRLMKMRPHMIWRLMRAKLKSREYGAEIRPKDLWKPKGLMCGGTDSACFKKRIRSYWGVQPLEIFGGTEPTCIATETWSKNGLVFFPDICFYEFIPEQEMERSLLDPSYQPNTFLMDELVPGEKYELVISNFKGGAFIRYRVGDVFRCVSTSNEAEGIAYPQFEYVDRIPTVIDIAGFTRITENTIRQAIDRSRLEVHNWFAVKRYDSAERPYMNLYVEMREHAITSGVVAVEVLSEHLSAYFRYVDSDYKDLKKMLGIDPLRITLLPTGTIECYETQVGRRLRHINPSHYDVTGIERMAGLR